MRLLTFLFLLWCAGMAAQNSAIVVDARDKDIGSQENIYKVRADYVIHNTLSKNLYLLRADAEKGLTVRTSRKTLKPNDTALIVLEFVPENTGKFNKPVNLVTSADGEPFRLSLSGNIKSIKTDDKTACFYFGKPNRAGVKETPPIVVYDEPPQRDNSNRMPDKTTASTPPVGGTTRVPATSPTPTVATETAPRPLLDPEMYKPNNIVFLVDVSSSMKDSTKLAVLQYSIRYLVDALRPTDKITLISYADSVKILKEGLSGHQKEELLQAVDKLKARGLTKGNKAILFSLDKALEHYIAGGNNQIILATDGKFRFYSEDQQKFISKKGDKMILLSTIAFGNDKEAMKNLKEIADIGQGNFIHIKSKSKARNQLLDEIREHSLIR